MKVFAVLMFFVFVPAFAFILSYYNKIYECIDHYSDGAFNRISSDLIYIRIINEKKMDEDSNNTILYVMGGTQDSLSSTLDLAGSLFVRHVSGKIHVLSRPGITEYSVEKKRNLYNDEWTRERIGFTGADKNRVVFVKIQTGLFGTLEEAKEVTAIARSTRVRRLIVVSTIYHTKRVYKSFSKYNRGHELDIYVYGATGHADRTEIALEYMKSRIYDFLFLLPACFGS